MSTRHQLCYNERRCRGVAQLVARTAGGREVASSSLVTPTIFCFMSHSHAMGVSGVRFFYLLALVATLGKLFASVLHALTNCFIIKIIMSEIPPFTDKPPVNLEDTELQIGMKKMREQLLGVMALEKVDCQKVTGAIRETIAPAKANDTQDHHGDLADLNDAFDELSEYDRKHEPPIERFSPETDDPEYLAFLEKITECKSSSEMYEMIMARKRLEGRPDLASI